MRDNGFSTCEGQASTLARPSQPSQGLMPADKWIEKVFRDELPKMGAAQGGRMIASPSATVAAVGELGMKLPPLNAFGLYVDEMAGLAGRFPSAAAIATYEAIRSLDDFTLEIGEDHDFAAGLMPAMGEDACGEDVRAGLMDDLRARIMRRLWREETLPDGARRMVMSEPLSALIRRFAIMGVDAARLGRGVPVCHVAAHARPDGRRVWYRRHRVEIGEDLHGQPVHEWVERMDGWNERARAPYQAQPGRASAGYLRFEIDPCPVDMLAARAVFSIWREAVNTVAEIVNAGGAASDGDFRPIGSCSWPAEPWADGASRASRVLEARPGWQARAVNLPGIPPKPLTVKQYWAFRA
jgi:hypothetical protein